jgi:hypothetical protein
MILGAAIILGAVAMISLSQTRRKTADEPAEATRAQVGGGGTRIAQPVEHGNEETIID